MGWFDSIKSPKLKTAKRNISTTPSGFWKKCVNCGEILQVSKLEENSQVCPYCDFHFRIGARERIKLLVDQDSFISFGEGLTSSDPLEFADKESYKLKLERATEKLGVKDGTYCGLAKIKGHEVALAVMDFNFMGGSMGVVTGEKIAYAMDLGLEKKIPVIVISASGGARMQEGILSLMQMAKTSASRQKLRNAGIPYISLLTDPTTGGCAASFAMLGDVNFAEPKALIGFAGPRVIEQSIRQSLPDGFQRAEFLQEHGFIDRIISRKNLRDELAFFIATFMNKTMTVI